MCDPPAGQCGNALRRWSRRDPSQTRGERPGAPSESRRRWRRDSPWILRRVAPCQRMTSAACSTIGSMTPGLKYLLPYFVGPHLAAGPEIPIHRQSPQRKVPAVPMVAEIKHPRESGACMANLFPRTILHLVAKQILDTASDAEGIGHPGRHEPHDSPSRLRGGTFTLPTPRRIAVRQTGLTPPTIRVLLRLEPGDRAANIGLRKILSD